MQGHGVNIGSADIVSIQSATDQAEQSQDIDILKYRKLADSIQVKVYNARHSSPSDSCLIECEELIGYKLCKRDYDVKFAIYEGQADVLRTSKCLDGQLYRHPIYKCLKLLAPYTSFRDIAMMIYRFRYAAALAISGCIQQATIEAEKGMEKLETFLGHPGMARITVSCLYGYINVQMAVFCETPDARQKENILALIEKGLEQVKVISDSDVYNMWMRMYLVKKALLLLRIGLSGEEVGGRDSDKISREEREVARQCLGEAKYHWVNTDNRRCMLYKRAKAQLCFLDGDKMAACDQLKKAINLAAGFEREERSFKHTLAIWNG